MITPLILVIDDEKNVCNLFVEILRIEGFNAVGATSGQAGLKMAQSLKPDLVLCDVMMPFMHGYEVLERLRQDPQTNAIPFIFLTALDTAADFRQGMNFGADDYLTKPVNRTALINAVRSRLSRYEQYKNPTELV
jgi:CheY-like chemotaxis protein